jgi:hypothetical protein
VEDIEKVVLEQGTPTAILGVPITVEDIRSRVALLSTLEGENLKGEMTKLKHALRANPEAANLMLPEEIGAMVQAIYKMTQRVVTQVAAKSLGTKAKKVDLKNMTELPADF